MERYTYRSFSTRRITAPFYVDALQSFGWELVGSESSLFPSGSLSLSFRRPERLNESAELARLQREFEMAAGRIESIEEAVNRKASGIAILIGFLGMVLMVLALVLRIIGNAFIAFPLLSSGLASCILSLFCYIFIISAAGKKTEHVVLAQFDKMSRLRAEAMALEK